MEDTLKKMQEELKMLQEEVKMLKEAQTAFSSEIPLGKVMSEGTSQVIFNILNKASVAKPAIGKFCDEAATKAQNEFAEKVAPWMGRTIAKKTYTPTQGMKVASSAATVALSGAAGYTMENYKSNKKNEELQKIKELVGKSNEELQMIIKEVQVKAKEEVKEAVLKANEEVVKAKKEFLMKINEVEVKHKELDRILSELEVNKGKGMETSKVMDKGEVGGSSLVRNLLKTSNNNMVNSREERMKTANFVEEMKRKTT